MLSVDIVAEAAPEDRLYRVAKGTQSLPKIVERVSKCGSVRLHAPASFPVGPTRICVRRGDHEVEARTADENSFLLQGRVVSCQRTTLVVSHGGLMLSVTNSNVDPCAWPNDAEVRTVVTCAPE